MKSVGRHLVLELWGCDNLNSPEIVERALLDIVEALRPDPPQSECPPVQPHRRDRRGDRLRIARRDSHLAELGYAAVDVFTCGEQRNPEDAVPVLREHFAPERIQIMEMTRGLVGV